MQHPWRPDRHPHRFPWVLLGHGLLLWAWVAALRHADLDIASNPAPAPLLRLLPVVPATPPGSPPEAIHHASRARTAVAPRQPRAVHLPITPVLASPLPTHGPGTVDAPTPGITLPTATQPLMQTDATRQALHEFARLPLLSERAASATERSPSSPADALASHLGGSLHGDCRRGDYPGGGMGLLSLPFLVAAQAAGRCAR